METQGIPQGCWRLKTADGAVYGPVDVGTVCTWAAEARVGPGSFLSVDGRQWTPAEDLPWLRLHWFVELPDGGSRGPLNLLAVWELAGDGALPAGTQVRHRDTQEAVEVGPALWSEVLRETREIIRAAVRESTVVPSIPAQPEEMRRLTEALHAVQERAERIEEERRTLAEIVNQRRLSEAEHQARLEEVRRQAAQTEQQWQERVVALEHAVQAATAELERTRAALAQEREANARTLAAQAERLQAAESAVGEARQALARTETRLREQEGLLRERDRELRQLHDELAARQADFSAAMESRARELAALHERLRQVQEALGVERQEQKGIRARLEADAATATQRAVALEQERDAVARELEAVRSALAAREAEVAGLQREAAELEQRWHTREQEYRQCIEALKRAAAAVPPPAGREEEAAAVAALREAREQAAGLESQLQALTAELTAARTESVRSAQRLNEIQQEAERRQARDHALQGQLRERIAALELELQQERGRMAALRAKPAPEAAAAGSRRMPAPPIDWLASRRHVSAAEAPAGSGETAGAGVARQAEQLRAELRAAAEAGLRMAGRLDEYRRLAAALKTDPARGDEELQARMRQLQEEMEVSAGLLQQTLVQLEEQEAALRSLREGVEQRGEELGRRLETMAQQQTATVEVQPEVVQTEPLPDPEYRAPAASRDVLLRMEAQARAELLKWQRLKAEGDKTVAKPKIRFWRKKA